MFIKQTEKLLEEYSYCLIDNSQLLSLSKEIYDCAKYQEVLKNGKQNEKNANYQLALQNYRQLKNLYKTGVVSQKLPKAPQTEVINYLHSSKNPYFLLYASEVYENENQHENAFQILKVCLKTGFSPRKTKDLQRRLGRWAGKKYFKKGRSYKAESQKLIGDLGRKLKYFYKDFKKVWRSLD